MSRLRTFLAVNAVVAGLLAIALTLMPDGWWLL